MVSHIIGVSPLIKDTSSLVRADGGPCGYKVGVDWPQQKLCEDDRCGKGLKEAHEGTLLDDHRNTES